jgi:hypothetical protein
VRAISWRAGLFLLIGIPVLLALGDALVGGMSFALLSYPLTMLSVWQHARRISRHAFAAAAAEASAPEDTAHQQRAGIARALDGGRTNTQAPSDVLYISQSAYDAGLQTKRRTPTIIEGIALAVAALMIASITLSIALPVFSAAKRRAGTAPRQAQATTFPAESATPRTGLDVTLPTRLEARKMADLLMQCGMSPHDAHRIALHKMPGQTLLEWWDSDILQPFNTEQRALLKQQLYRYLDVVRDRPENQSKAEFVEAVICAALQKDKGLSDTETFNLWQSGLLKQTDDSWNVQMNDLTPSRQRQLNRFRDELVSLSRTAEPTNALGTSDAQLAYEVWKRRRETSFQAADKERPPTPAHFSTRTEATTAVWNKLYPEAKASQQHRIAMQTLEDVIARFGAASAAVQTDAILDPARVTQDPVKQLQTFKASATDTLSAIHEYKEQTRLDLLRTRLTPDLQQRVITKTLEGYRLFEAWAAAALQAADAGITLRDLYSRDLPSEPAKQHFIDAWNASYDAQQAVISYAQATQQRAEKVLRK